MGQIWASKQAYENKKPFKKKKRGVWGGMHMKTEPLGFEVKFGICKSLNEYKFIFL